MYLIYESQNAKPKEFWKTRVSFLCFLNTDHAIQLSCSKKKKNPTKDFYRMKLMFDYIFLCTPFLSKGDIFLKI